MEANSSGLAFGEAWRAACRTVEEDLREWHRSDKADTPSRVSDAAMLRKIQDKLTSLEMKLRKYRLLVEDDFESKESRRLFPEVKIFEKELQELRAKFREASLKTKENAIKRSQIQREILLGADEESILRRRKLITEAQLLNASEEGTNSLQRSSNIMSEEVERSHNTLQTIGKSNLDLKKVNQEYSNQISLLRLSRTILKKLSQQDFIDRVILVLGTLMFLMACAYVVNKRIGISKLFRIPFSGMSSPPSTSSAPSPSPVPSPSPSSSLGGPDVSLSRPHSEAAPPKPSCHPSNQKVYPRTSDNIPVPRPPHLSHPKTPREAASPPKDELHDEL